MGTHHEDGYSAHVEGFFVVRNERYRVAKSNASAITLAEECEFAPGTVGELLVIVDGDKHSRLVELPEGICRGQSTVPYRVAAPF